MAEAEALAVHFENVDVVGEAVEDRANEALRSEYLGPFVEGQITRPFPLSILSPGIHICPGQR